MPFDEGDNELDKVDVLLGDLELFYSAIRRAHNFSFAHDLASGYQDLREDAKRSKLTNMLANVGNRLEAYLPVQEEEDGLEEHEPVE